MDLVSGIFLVETHTVVDIEIAKAQVGSPGHPGHGVFGGLYPGLDRVFGGLRGGGGSGFDGPCCSAAGAEAGEASVVPVGCVLWATAHAGRSPPC
jgi:hypothetical protein